MINIWNLIFWTCISSPVFVWKDMNVKRGIFLSCRLCVLVLKLEFWMHLLLSKRLCKMALLRHCLRAQIMGNVIVMTVMQLTISGPFQFRFVVRWWHTWKRELIFWSSQCVLYSSEHENVTQSIYNPNAMVFKSLRFLQQSFVLVRLMPKLKHLAMTEQGYYWYFLLYVPVLLSLQEVGTGFVGSDINFET